MNCATFYSGAKNDSFHYNIQQSHKVFCYM